MSTGRKSLALSIIILVTSVLAYLPSLKNNFVWDDKQVIEKSHFLFKASSIKNIIIPQENEQKKAKYYRPVHYVSIVFDKYIWGVNPLGFHLTNTILHAINTLLFFYLFKLVLIRFKSDEPQLTSFLGSLLFALHPIHTESVSWIAGRTDMICTLFFFTALISHILIKKNIFFVPIAIISYSLSLLSKELGIAFPFVVLCFDYLSKNFKTKSIAVYSIYTIITCVYIYLRGRAYINLPELQVLKESTAASSSFFIYIQPL